ncbi:MAG: U32 family peptidase [Gammaproteobacteria bacterium]|nr:MAG: U32 family peptidase [Gammaproteobacteria bacterium]
MQISLSQIPFNWDFQTATDFYREMAALPIDVIYIGNTVCSKRETTVSIKQWLQIAEELQTQGKQVIFSTLGLIETAAELNQLNKTCTDTPFMIEANDIGTVNILAKNKKEFACGPEINIYNHHTIKILQDRGMVRWTPPVELSIDAIANIKNATTNFSAAIDLFAFGYLPLAISARCYSARSEGINKENCDNVCNKTPYGYAVNTTENKDFLRINGTQTMSGAIHNALNGWKAAEAAGIESLRISPANTDMKQVVEQTHKMLEGEIASVEIELDSRERFCKGFAFDRAGIE